MKAAIPEVPEAPATATQILMGIEQRRQEPYSNPRFGEFLDDLSGIVERVFERVPSELPVEKQEQTGTLFPYTKQATTKSGNHTYPRVEERDMSLPAYRRKPEHWYWSFRFERKVPNKKTGRSEWKQKNLHVPRKKVRAVRAAIDEGWPFWRTAKEILGKEV